MHKRITLFSIIFLFPILALIANMGYYYYPDIQDETIVFSSQGSIWTVPYHGGTAKMITSTQSSRPRGKISPDGKYIAYSMSIDGNISIFIREIEGGFPRRLTYHSGRDYILGWTNDSSQIIFSSSRYYPHGRTNLFTLSTEGGYPEMINIGKADLISIAEDNDFIAFNRNASPHATWKRYKGGRMSEIWAGSLSKMDFTQITDFEGANTFPMIFGNRIYFLSDRRGRNNIFSMNFDGTDLTQHTHFKDFDIAFPSLGSGNIVFQKVGDIYRYDIEQDKVIKIDIKLPTDNITHIPVYESASSWINHYSLSSEAQRVLLDIRGNIYIVAVKEGRTQTIASAPNIRFKNPRFNSDSSKIAFFSDETGREQLYIAEAKDNSERIKQTDIPDGWYNAPLWSPDDKKIAFSDEKLSLYYFDLQSKETRLIDRCRRREIWNYSWSPCSRYIAYSKSGENGFSNIYIYDTSNKDTHQITSSVTMDREPVWDPDGNYLYYLSLTQFSPLRGSMDQNYILSKMVKPHIVLLNKDIINPFLPREWYELASGNNSNENNNQNTHIDLDGIRNRIYPFPVKSGNYRALSAVKNKIYFLDREFPPMMPDREFIGEDSYRSVLYSYCLDKKEMETVHSAIDSYSLSKESDKIVIRRDNQLRIDDKVIDLSRINLSIVPGLEWQQIYNEAVRLQRLLFWIPNMGNIDWNKYAKQYKEFLPRIRTRTELDMLIGDLIGELASSHAYIYSRRAEFPQRPVNIGLLGADFEIHNDLYRIKKIYEGDVFYRNAWSPLSIHPIEPGDYIIAVNGIPITADRSIHYFFQNLADQEIMITISKDGSRRNTEDYRIRPISSEFYLRYIDWVYGNRKYVEEKSNGRLGYIHIPDMSSFGLVQFFKQYYNQLDKEGLIIDDRYNGGGFVSQVILEKLRRELSYLSVMRHTEPRTSPRNTFLGHLVCLINEDSASDGDLFPEAFRRYGLGPLIGTKTWGGVVGIRSDKPFIDGGMMTIPEYSNYHIDDGWILENIGVDPDIEVINKPQDYNKGIDPQLDKGIEVLLQKLKNHPIPKPKIHPYPDNRIEAWIEFWENQE